MRRIIEVLVLALFDELAYSKEGCYLDVYLNTSYSLVEEFRNKQVVHLLALTLLIKTNSFCLLKKHMLTVLKLVQQNHHKMK